MGVWGQMVVDSASRRVVAENQVCSDGAGAQLSISSLPTIALNKADSPRALLGDHNAVHTEERVRLSERTIV